VHCLISMPSSRMAQCLKVFAEHALQIIFIFSYEEQVASRLLAELAVASPYR